MLLLTREGYEVFSAMDGCQAMQLACAHTPDALILDVTMPAGDGLSVQARLLRHASLCAKPVIYLTGERSEEMHARARMMGAFAILHKPLHFTVLLRTVREALAATMKPAV